MNGIKIRGTGSCLPSRVLTNDDLARQVEAQREANAALEDDIAHSGDPEYMADIARSKLGLLEPDEIEFVDSSK